MARVLGVLDPGADGDILARWRRAWRRAFCCLVEPPTLLTALSDDLS